MRWKKKKQPDIGDTRIIKKFLFFPKCINNECRWLEKVSIKQKFKRFAGGIDVYFKWCDEEWVYDY